MAVMSIFELGVDEAYVILTERLGVSDLPPLDTIENEDWGRDLLLDRFTAYSDETLSRLGLTLSGATDSGSF